MRINYYFGARQTGKTTTGLFLLHDQPKALFVTPYLDQHQETVGYLTKRKVKYSQLKYWQYAYAEKWETLILDEYHFASIEDKKEVLEFIRKHTTIQTVYVLTTPKHKYSRKVVELVAKGKLEGKRIQDIAVDIYNTIEFEVPLMSPAHLESAVEFLYYDILMLGFGASNDIQMKVDDALVFHGGKIRKLDPKVLGPYRDTEITGEFFTRSK